MQVQVLYMCSLQGSVRPTVLEQSRRVGGTWVYTPDTGTDENGLPRYCRVYFICTWPYIKVRNNKISHFAISAVVLNSS